MTALSPKLKFDLGLGMELGLGLVVLINVLLNLFSGRTLFMFCAIYFKSLGGAVCFSKLSTGSKIGAE